MGKLNTELIKYLTGNDFRTLTSVEMGMKNHEYVPVELCLSIADLKKGGGEKILKNLTENGLVAYEPQGKYGMSYRLTNAGYDCLALRVFTKKGIISYFGNQIGIGKESDIYVVRDVDKNPMCLKLHRLGRTSFRQVKNKRDYHKNRSFVSWLYLSRISATKEFAYLKALHDRGFPVPKPIENNRHAVLMELIDGESLSKIKRLSNPAKVYHECMDVITRLAECGLIHGDFNEFNLLLGNDDGDDDDNNDCDGDESEGEACNGTKHDCDDEEEHSDDGKLWVIDLPQMVSTSHENAKWYFERDVECIVTFFKRRFNYECDEYPNFDNIVKKECLDVEIGASGCIKKRKNRRKDDDDEEEESDLSDMLSSASLESSNSQPRRAGKTNKHKDEDPSGDDQDINEVIDGNDNKKEDDQDDSDSDSSDDDDDDDSDDDEDDGKDGTKRKVNKVEKNWRQAIKSELEKEQLKELRRSCRRRGQDKARSKKRGRKENFNANLKHSANDFF